MIQIIILNQNMYGMTMIDVNCAAINDLKH